MAESSFELWLVENKNCTLIIHDKKQIKNPKEIIEKWSIRAR